MTLPVNPFLKLRVQLSHREQAEVTKAEVAHRAGMSYQAINALEEQHFWNPYFETIVKLSQVYGCTPAELVTRMVNYKLALHQVVYPRAH